MRFIEVMCRIYSAMLYAYPRQFRVEYGSEMARVFRDRCREVADKPGRVHLIGFSAASVADWAATAVRESVDAWREAKKTRGPITEWTLTLLAYLFVTTTLVQAYVVPTGSMESTVKVGDHMLVERVDRTMHRGDIVAFLYPEDVRQTFVKRVIGLPGDHIRLENKRVIRNGRLLVEPYTKYVFPEMDAYRDNFPTRPDFNTSPRGLDMFAHHVMKGEVVVPPKTMFVLGDNRDNSLDSRYWGFVPQEYVIGRPMIVYWSFDAPTNDLEGWSLHHVLDVGEHFVSRTRWDRMFLIPHSQRAEEREPGE